MQATPQFFRFALFIPALLLVPSGSINAGAIAGDWKPDIRVGASAVNLRSDPSMVIAGSIESRYVSAQEGELRAVAVVVEKPGAGKIGIVACDVLWFPRWLVDEALAEIEKRTGIPPENILVNATHTHHAPSTAPAHDFGVSLKFCEELKQGIVRAVQEADRKLAGGEAQFYFAIGEEKTVGGNSRFKLPDGTVSWLRPREEAGSHPVPTGPFDPQLPVLDFRDANGKTRALLFNHSTHTIGTRGNKPVRSPSFYGLAAQELEGEIGGVVEFLEGASGSTHNVGNVPVDLAVVRMKAAVKAARDKARRHPVDRLAAVRRTIRFRVRHFNDAEEDEKIARYTTRHVPTAASSDYIRKVFANARKQLRDKQGEERETYVQAIQIGDVAIVGVPGEYFTVLGVDIKRRSPFKYTYVAELANDWIGYLPDREGHRLGGYQTWMGLHSYADVGTGERIADRAVELLKELRAKTPNRSPKPEKTSSTSRSSNDTRTAERSRRTPEQERLSFQLADSSLQIDLVAAEPLVSSPVAFAWSAEGSLYVAEMGGYPVTQNQGRIRRLRDTDGDGRYDESLVFADGLNFPATVMPYRDGVLTIDAPDLLFLRDRNRDGKADERRVLWTGFEPGSQQLRANALHWGLDNWIYGANGRCDGEIYSAGLQSTPVSLRGRDFRFRLAEGMEIKPGAFQSIAGQSQFGQCHDDRGNRFLSWNVIPIREAVVPEPYATVRTALQPLAIRDISAADDTGRVYPISPPPRQFNAERAEYYNAMCGLTIFRGDGLGADYAGNAFVGESLSNLVTRRVLVPRRLFSTAIRGETNREFLASSDPWFHPVFLATGPDGALYLADFYREYVEHPRYVASEEIRRRIPWQNGAENGRLWRIRRRGVATATAPKRALPREMSTAALVETLSDPNGWWRDTAQRLLIERRDPAAADLLRRAWRNGPRTPAALHVLWTLDGLHAIDAMVLRRALRSSEPEIRRHAVAIAESRPAIMKQLTSELLALVNDDDAAVQYRFALMLGGWKEDEVRLDALVKLAQTKPRDPLLLAAILSSARGQTGGLIRLLAEVDPRILRDHDQATTEFLVEAAEQIAAETDGDALLALVQWCAETDRSEDRISPGRLALLGGFARGRVAATALSNSARSRIARAALTAAGDRSLSPPLRECAVRLLAWLETPAEAGRHLVPLLAEPSAAGIHSTIARCLADLNSIEASRAVYAEWDRLGGDARRSVLNESPNSRAATTALLDAMAANNVRPVEVSIDVVERLKKIDDRSVRERVRSAFHNEISPNRRQVIDAYKAAGLSGGEPIRGAAIFRENCMTCHTIQRFGQQVGPELSGASSRPVEILLHDILDPSAQISTDFLNFVLVTQQGKSYEGLLVSQSADAIRLRRAQGEEVVVPTRSVEQLRASNKSLMPEGFETKIDPRAMRDLLAFLRQPSRDLLKGAADGSAARGNGRVSR